MAPRGVERAEAHCQDRKPTGPLLHLVTPREPGDRLVFVGRVMDSRNRAVPGATVFVYHADAYGAYAEPGATEPRLCGVLRADGRGSFRIETVLPSGRKSLEPGAPHIHGTVWGPGHGRTSFVVNLDPQPGRFVDAAFRAGWGIRGSTQRKVYQDRSGTWWLIWNPRLG